MRVFRALHLVFLFSTLILLTPFVLLWNLVYYVARTIAYDDEYATENLEQLIAHFLTGRM